MRLVEIVQTVPRFFLSVLAVAWSGPGGRTLTILLGSWGSLINNAQPYLEVAWWMWVFPGAAIVTAVLGMNLLADGLTGALAHE